MPWKSPKDRGHCNCRREERPRSSFGGRLLDYSVIHTRAQILRDRRAQGLAAFGGLAVVAVALLIGRGGDDTTASKFSAATVTLNVIGGDVRVVADGTRARAGRDGEALAVGMIVEVEPPDGRAVLTFRDGSTVELEPEASVKIDEHSLGTRGELLVRLYQDRGKTWSHVQPQLSPSSRFHVRTPSGTAVVRGTSFEVDVARPNEEAITKVTVFDGRVDLVAAGSVEVVNAGFISEVSEGRAPQAARRAIPPEVCLRVEVSDAALVIVTDPKGRSAGQTPLGTVSQIPQTSVSGPLTGPQSIDVFSPTPGDWEIGIVPRADGGAFQLRVVAMVGDQRGEDKLLVSTAASGQRLVTRIGLGQDGRPGRLEPPVNTTKSRAVALPADHTATADLPQARLVAPVTDPSTPSCGIPGLAGDNGVRTTKGPQVP